MEKRVRFEETQAFPLWGYALVVGALAAALAGVVKTAPAGRALPDLLGASITALAANLLSMKTVVTEEALTVSFGWLVPLYQRRIPLSEIADAAVVTYSPLKDYGGWGIRYGGWGSRGRDDMALNARGNRGVRLTLTDGKRVLIGSQHPEELAAALQQPPSVGA